jgi:hypothetical protein
MSESRHNDRVIQAFLPLIRRGAGRIVNAGSLGGLLASESLTASASGVITTTTPSSQRSGSWSRSA